MQPSVIYIPRTLVFKSQISFHVIIVIISTQGQHNLTNDIVLGKFLTKGCKQEF